MARKTFFKDGFVLREVTGPHRYSVPSLISAQQRNIEVLDCTDGAAIVHWWYEDDKYSEEYQLQLPLDTGCVPKSDGSGIISNGFEISFNFYEPAR